MAKGTKKKKKELTIEEKLEQALVPEEEWPYEVPENWCWTYIKDLCKLINGRAFKPTDWSETGLPIIRIQNLNNPDSKYNLYKGEVNDKHRLYGGELLFAWSGTPGTSFGAHVWQGGDAVLNQNVYEYLYSQQDQIEVAEHYISSSNIDSVSLKIGLLFLYTAMGKDVYKEILELMPYIKDDVATTVSVSSLIAKYLEIKNDVVLPTKIESIVLQNVLLWLQSDFSDIRWNATRILLTMTRNRDNYGIVNHQLVDLIDSKSVYIKNLILRNLNKMEGITDETKKHVISKCKNDVNYVVRMVCSEVVDNTLDELCSN